MDSLVTQKNRILKCGAAIKTLSIIALVCTVLSCSSLFFYESREYIDGEWVIKKYTLVFSTLDLPGDFSTVFSMLVILLLALLPYIMFVLYVFKSHNKPRGTVILPLIFILAVIRLNFYGFWIWEELYLLVPGLLSFVFLTIGAYSGFKRKFFIVATFIFSLLLEVFFVADFFSYEMGGRGYLRLCNVSLNIIGKILFYVALFLFGLKNRIPSIRMCLSAKEKVAKTNPEKELKILKEKLELNIITEEEYQAQRTEIVSKL